MNKRTAPAAQTITVGGTALTVVPLEEYNRLMERSEMLDDIETFDRAMARLKKGEETFPLEVAKRLAKGESPVRVYREYRGLSQKDLAEAADVSVPMISRVEKCNSAGVETFAAIAQRLGVTIDDLV